MKNEPEITSSLIEPLYFQREPNEAINVGEIELVTGEASNPMTSVAKVTQIFLPNESLEFRLDPFANSMKDVLRNFASPIRTNKVKFKTSGISIDVIPVRSGSDGTILHPASQPVEICPKASDLISAKCYLFNLPAFSGDDDYTLTVKKDDATGWYRCGRIVLKFDGWEITIAAMKETSTIAEALRETGGYALTHVAQIARDNETTFSSDELKDVLSLIHFYLSFSLGRRVGVGFAAAFDAAGQRKWDLWGIGMVDRGAWHAGTCWFDCRHAHQLSEAFLGFSKLWTDPIWKKPLTEIIYWYLRANSGGAGFGIDTGLIIAQAALELLAWTLCVKVRQMVSPEAFGQKALKAADKLRMMMTVLDIPTKIPAELTTLSHRPGKNFKDIPEAIISIRNSLVHPGGETTVPKSGYFEVWKLACWVIETCLLSICKYNGSYSNRLRTKWVGEIEPVPWAH